MGRSSTDLREDELLLDAIIRGGGDADGDAVARAWGFLGCGAGRLVRGRGCLEFRDRAAIREALSLRGAVRTATLLDSPELIRDYLAAGFAVTFSSPPRMVRGCDDRDGDQLVRVDDEWLPASVVAEDRAVALSGFDGWPPCTAR